ncbi:hypothetical protein HN873_058582 [Arachis hypogaea]
MTTSSCHPRGLKRLASSSSGLPKNTHDTPPQHSYFGFGFTSEAMTNSSPQFNQSWHSWTCSCIEVFFLLLISLYVVFSLAR